MVQLPEGDMRARPGSTLSDVDMVPAKCSGGRREHVMSWRLMRLVFLRFTSGFSVALASRRGSTRRAPSAFRDRIRCDLRAPPLHEVAPIKGLDHRHAKL